MIPLRDTSPSRKVPIATFIIIGINALIFLYQTMITNEMVGEMVFNYGFIPIRFIYNVFNPLAYIPFITNIFLHSNLIHLLGNMWSLWIFGDNVEDRMGPLRFTLFYILAGVIATIFHMLSDISSYIPVIGASGAIAGVMGAYFLMFKHSRVLTIVPIFPFFIQVPAQMFLIIWFLIQLSSGISSGLAGQLSQNIAWWAHIFGFLAGVFLHKLFIKKNINYYRRI
ncbi:rhomboid family intramembrane serine protease [Senegalia massiliensis]|uniref:rhomboid family intramembrane serine protease n=1 Tax=Senegalia massiliensis TaxID=1720316 RepID=UPI00102FC45E|nr:rhomboid family intramembrane serine protease [Senegalia massiliensis]